MHRDSRWTVVDLFSGAGGMSYGFHAHPGFRVAAAVDAQLGKPSSGNGSLQCNLTYAANIGVEPLELDLGKVDAVSLRNVLADRFGVGELSLLIACPPCTGFSRAMPDNHLRDDHRNSLVQQSALFAVELRPSIVLMENARELMMGRFAHHYTRARRLLEDHGYTVSGAVHVLSRFGLAQQRERAVVVAVRDSLALRTLEDLWEGYEPKPEATHVRRAIAGFPKLSAGQTDPLDSLHSSPSFADVRSLRRLQLIPHDGGSWSDLVHVEEAEPFLTPAMRRYASKGDFGSHPDVYGRMWWDRPSVTIKRECGHVGNGRYAHPEQDRLCTVREMATLQGFPRHYKFVGTMGNTYRHIGDAVPPLISYQLAHVCGWILSGTKPSMCSVALPDTHLCADDIQECKRPMQMELCLR